MKDASSERRDKNRVSSAEMLKRHDVHYETKNNGIHLIVKMHEKIWDFWPGTGKYKRRDSSDYRHGVKNLLKEINSFK